MEEFFIYILKSSGLITSFFLAYHFLLRKETFFNNNRWFLLSGLFISATLPLYFIKKVIVVEKPKLSIEDLLAMANHTKIAQSYTEVTPQIESISWLEIAFIGYLLITAILFIKVVFDLISLFKLLNKNKIEKQNGLSYIDMQEDIAPFSFFNFIVFNSSLYSQHELESILSHEKIHSKQKHSFDVLFAKLFTIIFWFNPFAWLYKKAIIQNLEYIADNQAIQLIEDKKCYQMALLKVVSHQNCLPITNHFYQSLIKKRIVMLNKNQSHKRNIWKYTVVIPVLIAFVFLFQVKVEAQQKETSEETSFVNRITIDWSKNSTNEEIEKDIDYVKNTGVSIKYSKIKRNSNGEIIALNLKISDKKGNTDVINLENNEPIKPIIIIIDVDKNGQGSYKYNTGIDKKNLNDDETIQNDSIPEVAHGVDADNFWSIDRINEDGNDYLIIIDGKKQEKYSKIKIPFDREFDKMDKITDKQLLKKYGADGKNGVVLITTKKASEVNSEKELKTFITKSSNNDDVVVIRKPNVSGIKVPGEPTLNLNENPLIIINGQKFDKKTLDELEEVNIETVDVLKGNKATKVYGKDGENGVIVVRTKTFKNNSDNSKRKNPIIFSNDNGDDITLSDNYQLLKLPKNPAIRFTQDSPILIVNGNVQSNPKATMEIIDATNIKSVRIYDENDNECKGTIAKKVVITTK